MPAACYISLFPSFSHQLLPLLCPPCCSQLLKCIIGMSNYRSPCYQICDFWSMRSALEMLELNLDLGDELVVYSSDINYNLVESSTRSILVRSIQQQDARWPSVYAVRQVRSFERGSLEVRSSDWIIAQTCGFYFAGRVGEMVEFCAGGLAFVCMLLRDAREIDAFDQTRGQYIVVPLCKPCSDRVLMCERSSFHEVYCDVSHDGELRLTYIY